MTKDIEQDHFQILELDESSVPIGCPGGFDPPEDVVPDHHDPPPPYPFPVPCNEIG